ncbi:MAG: GNAT family N-acetyltransferase [Pseudomonadota bacterium]
MVTVARARPEDIANCVALLPRLAFPETNWLTARDGDAVVGAAGLVWLSSGDDASFPIAVEVLPSARRRGVGRALVAAAQDLADGETDALHSALPIAADDPAGAFAEACGFTPSRRSFEFLVGTQEIVAHMAALVSRLRRSGRVPDSARVVAARDADRFELAHLVATEFHNGPIGVYNGLTGDTLAPDGRLGHSLAVLDGDFLAGACLWTLDGEHHGAVEANVVAPTARRGWANALLVEATVRAMRDAGADSFRFSCDEHVRDTVNIATRGGGAKTATKIVWRQALAS